MKFCERRYSLDLLVRKYFQDITGQAKQDIAMVVVQVRFEAILVKETCTPNAHPAVIPRHKFEATLIACRCYVRRSHRQNDYLGTAKLAITRDAV